MGPILGGVAFVKYSADRTNIVFDGNSLVQGNATANPARDGIVPQLNALYPVNSGLIIKNIGVSGQSIADMRNRGPEFADASYIPGKRNILFVWEGTNSICNNGLTGADAGAQIAAYCSERLAANPGWIIIMMTTLPRFNITTRSIVDGNTQLDIFDSYVKQNYLKMGAKKLVDVRASGIFTYTGPEMSNVMSPYMIDNIHYNGSGGRLLAQYCASALVKLRAR